MSEGKCQFGRVRVVEIDNDRMIVTRLRVKEINLMNA